MLRPKWGIRKASLFSLEYDPLLVGRTLSDHNIQKDSGVFSVLAVVRKFSYQQDNEGGGQVLGQHQG